MGRIAQLPVIAVNATNPDGTGGPNSQPGGAVMELWVSVPNHSFRIIGAYVFFQPAAGYFATSTYTDGTIKIPVQIATANSYTPFAEGVLTLSYQNVSNPPTGLAQFIYGYVSLSGFLPEGAGLCQIRLSTPDTVTFFMSGSGLNPSGRTGPWAALVVEEL